MKPKKSWWVLFIISIGVIIPFVAPYVTLDPDNSRVSITSSGLQFPMLMAHIVTACVALLSGFFQFLDLIRIKTPKVHRLLGRVYMCSVLISGLLGLIYVPYIENFSKAASFLVLSLIWLFTCWKGYRTAVRKQFAEHRNWMIRSFGITLVAVSGRIVVPILLLTYYTINGFSLPSGREKMIEEVLNANIWVGLIVNFIVVEWGILRKDVSKG
ncbi:DUF2306 domain-containing protein, partial [Neobacillus drentensis]|uniref:DUF2306 domain-containing protein n=1 Tax=Neobacillus drentensis TaxID=220684 RepID=UPI00300153F7